MAGALARVVARISKGLGGLSGLPTTIGSGGWFNFSGPIFEAYPGAWQKNEVFLPENSLTNFAVFACVTRIAQDIAKIRFVLEELSDDAIWQETATFMSPFLPVLLKPNPYQTHVQFKESWLLSKLTFGNAYALKVRDKRGIVTSLSILHPQFVIPVVTPDGAVYYRLTGDNLAQVAPQGVTVPASEIVHDRFNCLFHPLVGISPLFSAGMAANNGLVIQRNSSNFFANASNPGGIISVPEEIPQQLADEIKTNWNANYGGPNAGKVAVLGGAMTYIPMRATAVDSQQNEQLQMTAQIVCSTFHVPAYMIGMDAMPASRLSVEALEIDYYTKCLQIHIASMEASLTEGLSMTPNYRVALDVDELTRMDTTEKATAIGELVKSGIMSPNEGRRPFRLGPVAGGETPYLQQQNFPLEALAKLDRPAVSGSQASVPAVAAAAHSPPNDAKAFDSAAATVKALASLAKRFEAEPA